MVVLISRIVSFAQSRVTDIQAFSFGRLLRQRGRDFEGARSSLPVQMPCAHFACVCFAGLEFVVEGFAQCSFFRGDSNKLVGFSYHQWFRTKLVACVSNTIGRGDKVRKRTIKCEDSAANSIIERSALLQYISDVDGDNLGVVLGVEA